MLRAEVDRLDGWVGEVIRQDAHAVIDEQALSDLVDLRRPALRALLVELVNIGAFDTVFFWHCPNGAGVCKEAKRLSDFPDRLECDRCGQEHWFNDAEIEVSFVASDSLRVQAREESGRR